MCNQDVVDLAAQMHCRYIYTIFFSPKTLLNVDWTVIGAVHHTYLVHISNEVVHTQCESYAKLICGIDWYAKLICGISLTSTWIMKLDDTKLGGHFMHKKLWTPTDVALLAVDLYWDQKAEGDWVRHTTCRHTRLGRRGQSGMYV